MTSDEQKANDVLTGISCHGPVDFCLLKRGWTFDGHMRQPEARPGGRDGYPPRKKKKKAPVVNLEESLIAPDEGISNRGSC